MVPFQWTLILGGVAHDDLSTPQPRPSSHELSVDVQLDYQQLPEEGKQSWGV